MPRKRNANSPSSSSQGDVGAHHGVAELHAHGADHLAPRAGCPRAAACTRPPRRWQARRGAAGRRTRSPRTRAGAAQRRRQGRRGPRRCRRLFPGDGSGLAAAARHDRRNLPSRSAAAARSRWASCCTCASRRSPRTGPPRGRPAHSSCPERWPRISRGRSRAVLPLAIFLMKRGTSMCVGQAAVQGASKQLRHLLASVTADWRSRAGCRSGNCARLRASGSSGALMAGPSMPQ